MTEYPIKKIQNADKSAVNKRIYTSVEVAPLKASETSDKAATNKSYKQCIYKAVIQYI